MQHDRVTTAEVIVLAAGEGTRFGGAKLLAPFRGEPLILASVRIALAVDARAVTVVLGADAAPLATVLGQLANPRLRLVQNADWSQGLASSLRCGLASLAPDASAALIFLGDMPNVSVSLGNQVLQHVSQGAPAAYPVFAGLPGHPVAIARGLFPALEGLEGDRGARAVLATCEGVVRIDTQDPGCVHDVDTKADYDALAHAEGVCVARR